MNKTALVTAIGSFSADITIKTLRNLGFCIIGCDIYPAEWIADSANVDFFGGQPVDSPVFGTVQLWLNQLCSILYRILCFFLHIGHQLAHGEGTCGQSG